MDIYDRYNLTRVINASGKMTYLAGSKVLPEIVETVDEAMQGFFLMDELQTRAGEKIAQVTGFESGCVTACTAAGIALCVAACMTGDDLGRVHQLPDTTGMKDRVVIHLGHCVNFGAPIEQMIRLAGARVDTIGTVNGASVAHLEHALTAETAAAVYVVSHHTVHTGCVPLEKFVEVCHSRSVPVIIDGAAQDLQIEKLVQSGADLIIASAHKYLCSTTAGMICGTRKLIPAVRLQDRGIGRAMKVGKEGVLGLIAALDFRARQDIPDWTKEQDRKMHRILEQLQGIPGLALGIEPDPNGNPFSRPRLAPDPAICGKTAVEVCEALAAGNPTIQPRAHHAEEGYFTLDQMECTDEEIDLICRRVREILAP